MALEAFGRRERIKWVGEDIGKNRFGWRKLDFSHPKAGMPV